MKNYVFCMGTHLKVGRHNSVDGITVGRHNSVDGITVGRHNSVDNKHHNTP